MLQDQVVSYSSQVRIKRKMIKLFREANLDNTCCVKPICVYYCPYGACGSPGLYLTILENGDCYYGDCLDHNNNDLINKIVINIPELNLIFMKQNVSSKRVKVKLRDVYLGLGNSLWCTKNIAERIEKTNEHKIIEFENIFKEYTGHCTNDLFVTSIK